MDKHDDAVPDFGELVVVVMRCEPKNGYSLSDDKLRLCTVIDHHQRARAG